MVQIDPEKYPGAVFDLDGVITDTASLHFRAWSQTFDELFIAQRRGPPEGILGRHVRR